MAGVGYVDPDAHKVRPSTDPDFVVGGPVYDPSEAQRLREARMAEQRELELKWVKKQRPNNVSAPWYCGVANIVGRLDEAK